METQLPVHQQGTILSQPSPSVSPSITQHGDPSRFRRSSSQPWWTGSRLSLAPLSCWTRTAAWSPPWSITSHITSRTWRDTTSKLTKGNAGVGVSQDISCMNSFQKIGIASTEGFSMLMDLSPSLQRSRVRLLRPAEADDERVQVRSTSWWVPTRFCSH